MYKLWRLGNLALGIATMNQIALGGGITWTFARPRGVRYCYIYAWLGIGPLHLWLVWERMREKQETDVIT